MEHIFLLDSPGIYISFFFFSSASIILCVSIKIMILILPLIMAMCLWFTFPKHAADTLTFTPPWSFSFVTNHHLNAHPLDFVITQYSSLLVASFHLSHILITNSYISSPLTQVARLQQIILPLPQNCWYTDCTTHPCPLLPHDLSLDSMPVMRLCPSPSPSTLLPSFSLLPPTSLHSAFKAQFCFVQPIGPHLQN